MKKNYTLLLAFFVFQNVAAQVQQNDTTKAKALDEVIVTGQYKPQSLKNSVYQVRTISKERIQKQGAINLQTVLNNELNIRFSQDVATGGADITMMGLKGQNVKILIDGLPVTGRQGTSNEININQIDINTIERIEIVEGPMAVIYGSDALAGVINIITKKAAPEKFTVTARLHEETVGKEYAIQQGIHNQYIGATARIKNWELGGGFGNNYFGGWKDTAVERELVWHKKDQLLANGFIAYHKGKINMRYRIDGLDEVITNPGNFLNAQLASGDTLAYDQEYLTQRLMHQLQGTYTANNNFNVLLQSSYSNYSRQVFSTTVSKKTDNIRLNTAAGAQSIVDFTGFTFRTLVNYRLSNKVALQPGVDINTDRGEGDKLNNGNNVINDYAFFITSEITPSAKINIRPGIRVIKNSVYNAPPVIPSVNAKFAVTKNIDARLAYAKGFRSPSIRELYFNFFDASHQIIGNPNLKAETSHSFTGSLNFKKVSAKQVVYTTVLSGFYNAVKNLIDYGVSPDNPNNFTLLNVSDSRTAGANINTIVKYKQWNVAVGAAYTGFYNDYSEVDETLPAMQWSPEVNTTAGYSFLKIGLDVNLFYKFTGKRPFYVQQNQGFVLSKVNGFSMADFTVNKKVGKYILLNTGIRNLFNVTRINSTVLSNGVHANNGARSIANGRSFFAGINFNWAKK
jgi:outer membrane receptor for ferrienterochelin and colicins